MDTPRKYRLITMHFSTSIKNWIENCFFLMFYSKKSKKCFLILIYARFRWKFCEFNESYSLNWLQGKHIWDKMWCKMNGIGFVWGENGAAFVDFYLINCFVISCVMRLKFFLIFVSIGDFQHKLHEIFDFYIWDHFFNSNFY